MALINAPAMAQDGDLPKIERLVDQINHRCGAGEPSGHPPGKPNPE
jgi:hypothetical protein